LVAVLVEAKGKEFREISNAKKVLSNINTLDDSKVSFQWPTQQIKQKAGKTGWGTWRPANGMQGEIVMWTKLRSLLLIDGKYYVVVDEKGLKGEYKPKDAKEGMKEEDKWKWDPKADGTLLFALHIDI
jgi:hypothetical protein